MKPTPRLRLLFPLLLLPLSACSLLASGSRDAVTIYAPQVSVAPDPAWPQVAWQLSVAKPSAARIVDSPRINVRPSPDELEVYRGVTWAQSATDMVEDSVLRAFEDSGRIAGVARSATGIRADYRLVLDLRRFEADYAGQALPAATIELNAKLLHNIDQRIVASRTFVQAVPAATTGTADVAKAFEQALSKATSDVVGWTLTSGQADSTRL
ncbi:ABC-type transport auxiliary lipoprotein family protein [Stenotrophomonas sp. MMGLT7]|uniref:ABC-type transport auxiliary lipoprotein family protein n=1 Tax=Stenotrophomonas sp. MMGLT7 TaxID=2901227 RepID=UPI001E5F456A|nr:ABC-type transport auxiliary lipoprotein family protein [Stenotrophomonas sp. MMGLT7]MCD7100276.1 ABC-type transport auxiliary lipoprotein family protein [Stenotrophomonas sp. MMGLT7]